MFEYFYHEIFRKTVIGFGTLFNNINIKHRDGSDNTYSVMKVPLAYGPTQKFLARLEQAADLNKPVQLSLPRLSFEMTGLSYDPTRKTTATKSFITREEGDKKTQKKTYMPVPYNMRFELSIMSKTNEDALQIIEQILPYFQPAYNLTITLVDAIKEKKDIPIQLEGISMDDQYEGDFTTRKALIYTIRFSAKTYLFGPVGSSSGLIKSATVDVTTIAPRGPREVRYTVTPRATQDYDNDATTSIAEDLSAEERYITVNDASSLSVYSRFVIDSEMMYIEKIDGNQLVVKRGYEGTVAAEHVNGATVNVLTAADDALIEVGDDFGFNETVSFFQDFKDSTREGDI